MADEREYYDAEEHDKQKARVEEAFNRWVKRLGLCWWTINIDYVDGLVGHHTDANDCWSTVMVCESQWQYMQATIAVALAQCVGVSDDEIERYALHELMHVFLSETREPADEEFKHEERVVCTLTSAFLWMRNAAVGNELEEQIAQRTGVEGVDFTDARR